MDREQLEAIYQTEGYYWGEEPNELARNLVKLIGSIQLPGKRIVDLGAGEGRDSVFFAQKGLDVLAIDLAPSGLNKAGELAEKMGTSIQVLEADLNDLVLDDSFDIVYSIGALQYIEPGKRERQFHHIKEKTNPGGLHVLCSFVKHPALEIAPDWGKNEYLYERNELQDYYTGWQTVYSEEFVIECMSSGIEHQHCVSVIITQKPE